MPERRQIAIFTYGTGVMLAIMAVLVASSIIWDRYDAALAEGSGQTVRFVRGAEAALNRNVLGVDVLLASMDSLLELAEAVGPSLSDEQAIQLMTIAINQNPLVRYAAVLGPDGRLIASSDRRGRPKRVDLPEGFVAQVLAQPVPTLTVSAPIVSFSTSEKVLYFGRSLLLGGQQRAAAIAEVQISVLASILTQGVDITGLEVTLERDDGQLLVSVPSHEALSGRQLLPALGESFSTGDAMRLSARLSGEPAIVVARPTLYRSLVVAASLPLQATLADWRDERTFIVGAAILFIMMVLAASIYARLQLLKHWRARAEITLSKRALDQALESMVEGFVLLDPQERVITWNRRFLEFFPWLQGTMTPLVPYRKVVELTDRHVLLGGGGNRKKAWRDRRSTMHHAGVGEHEVLLPQGKVVQITRSRTPDGGLVCLFQDITEKKRQTAAIVEGNAQLQATLDALPDLLLEVGLDGHCYGYHAPRIPLVGINVDELLGKRLIDLLPPEGASEVMQALRDADAVGHSKGRQFERSTGPERAWFEISVSRKASAGDEARFIVILRDITKSKQAAHEIEKLAFYDTLTGLPNRRLLLQRLQRALDKSRRTRRHGALLFLDLDDFKTLNDTRGHDTGDFLLKEVAVRLNACMDEGDTVARLGGDEFIVMLENLSENPDQALAETEAMGDALLEALDEPYEFAAQHYRSTASIGVVMFFAHEKALDDLLKHADIAMYYAKTAGGNALRFFDPSMQATITARATLEIELRKALEDRQFVLYYQSQVTHDARIVGAEALIRWQHPQLGLVLPRGFIMLAEETGLILPIGLWVLETACERLRLWGQDPARQHLQLAVNVSARQFRRDDFVEQVYEVLERTGANPSRLKLELTESLLLDKVDDTILKMNALKRIGVKFSMDDFGTGYSSLSYMTQLPLDQLKIDQFFVHNITRNEKVGLIIQTIIGMARNLDLEIIAEGVETEEQRAFLERHGCPLCQGHLFSVPMPVEEFEVLLRHPALQ